MIINVINKSKITEDELLKVLAAIQIQINDDFSRRWDKSADLVSHTGEQSGMWNLYLSDETDEGDSLLVNEETWTHDLSIRILEIIVNPDGNRAIINDNELTKLEVCAPVDGMTYEINGIVVANFVTPAWFNAESKDVEFDLLGKIEGPLQIGEHGRKRVGRLLGTWVTKFKGVNE